jgi:TonB family protein
MKSSASCTTQSSRVQRLLPLFVSALLIRASLAAQAGASPDAKETLVPVGTSAVPVSELVHSNFLERQGNTPFHLKTAFQVFDETGKPSETGTLEYWWAAPERSYVEVISPSVGTAHATSIDGIQNVKAARTLYLANMLLGWLVAPAGELGGAHEGVTLQERVIAGAVLECLQRQVPPDSQFSREDAAETCTDQQTGTVRLVQSRARTVVRNRTGTFGKTHVALSVDVSWYGRKAIQGTVEVLKGVKPEEITVPLSEPRLPSPERPEVRLAGGVIAGHKISGSSPVYPLAARQERIAGTVVLAATITKDGAVEDLIPLSSPDDVLTRASLDAVRQWRYKPYLLNGAPVRVATTITVNFNLRVGM